MQSGPKCCILYFVQILHKHRFIGNDNKHCSLFSDIYYWRPIDRCILPIIIIIIIIAIVHEVHKLKKKNKAKSIYTQINNKCMHILRYKNILRKKTP